jgi:hypothetical protein
MRIDDFMTGYGDKSRLPDLSSTARGASLYVHPL